MTGQPCVFLDRDGVIVIPEFRDGRSFAPTTLEAFCYFPKMNEILMRLKKAGYLLIVITNQPDVGQGIIKKSVVENMHLKMQRELPIDHIEVCYHAKEENCHCRKPKPGMLLKALEKFNISIEKSFMIGDRWSDIEAGGKINLTTLFIDYQYQEPITTPPDYICKNLEECTNIIFHKNISSFSPLL